MQHVETGKDKHETRKDHQKLESFEGDGTFFHLRGCAPYSWWCSDGESLRQRWMKRNVRCDRLRKCRLKLFASLRQRRSGCCNVSFHLFHYGNEENACRCRDENFGETQQVVRVTCRRIYGSG